MAIDKRSNEASSLRKFFDDQINYVQQLFSAISEDNEEEKQQLVDDNKVVESFVNGSNNWIRAVRGYENKLRPSVLAIYHHVHQVSAEIPDPIGLNKEFFSNTPLINALFVNHNDIDALLDANVDVKKFFRDHYLDDAPMLYGFLTATKKEKRTLGVGMMGDMVVHDVPQDTVSFSNHKLYAPSPRNDALLGAINQFLFDRVVAQTNLEMKERLMHQSGSGRANSYEARLNSLRNPEVYLSELIQYLSYPPELLGIEKSHLKLSKLGVKLNKSDTQAANEFDIHELIWADQSRQVILRVSYHR